MRLKTPQDVELECCFRAACSAVYLIEIELRRRRYIRFQNPLHQSQNLAIALSILGSGAIAGDDHPQVAHVGVVGAKEDEPGICRWVPLGEIEQENFSRIRRGYFENLLSAHGGAIARL